MVSCDEEQVDGGFNFIFETYLQIFTEKSKMVFILPSVLRLYKFLLYFILVTNNFEQAIISRNYFS